MHLININIEEPIPEFNHKPLLQLQNFYSFNSINKENFNFNNSFLFPKVFKFESEEKTPINFHSITEKSWHSPINKMITIANNLDISIVSYKSEHSANPFVNIVKMNTDNILHNTKSLKELRGHTDGVAHRLPSETQFNHVSLSPDFIILTCLRNNKTPTRISFLADILSLLDEEEKHILSQPIYCAYPQLSYDDWLQPLYPVALLNNNFSEIRFSHDKIKPIDHNNSKAINALLKLKNIVEKTMINVNLSEGDIIFINNRTCLHGRGNPGSTIEDKDRWIIRSYGIQNKNITNNIKELL